MTISFIIYHHFSRPTEELITDVASYFNQRFLSKDTSIEIIIMLEQVHSDEAETIKKALGEMYRNIKIVEMNKAFVGPGAMWNQGYSLSKGDYIVYTWSGVSWHMDSLFQLMRMMSAEQLDAVYGMAKYMNLNDKSSFIEVIAGIKELSASSISFVNSIPLCYMLITRKIVELLGGFIQDKELAQIADWEFLIRLTRRSKTDALIGMPITIKLPLADISYNYFFKQNLDALIRNYITTTYNREDQLPQALSAKVVYKGKACKIAIVGVPTENVQVQLCFLNYFEALREQSFLTWRRFSESQLKAEELEGYDSVFFVRCSTQNALFAAKYCREKRIKTVYLLDDNWFHITETYPHLEAHMGTNTAHSHFSIFLIRAVDYVLVYNSLLAEDIKKYNPSVLRLKPNVNLNHFNREEVTLQKEGLRIGFAGSASKVQHFDPAFKALAKILADFKGVSLFFKGIELPDLFQPFHERITQTAYTLDYKKYAREVSGWECDIMISPLDATRYTNSKCPNKYLEITAAGACGIYSNKALYKEVITDHYNGLIIDNLEEEWYSAITELIEDKALRKSLLNNATQDIRQKYETQAVLPSFMNMLEQVLDNKLNITVSTL